MSIRRAGHDPILTAVLATTFGLGIGVNTAVFAMIHGLLLRGLPYHAPSELVLINRMPLRAFFASYRAFDEWKRGATFLSDAALFVEGEANLFGGSEPVHVHVANVSTNLLSLLGSSPIIGRNFRKEEQRPGQDRVVLLSHEIWERQFGSDSRITGRNIRLNGTNYEVIGVLPRAFSFPEGTDVWVPSAHDPIELRSFGSVGRFVLGRLRQGMSVAKANTVHSLWMQSGAAGEKLPPKESPYWHQLFVRSLQDQLVSTLRTPLLMIWAAALLVLFIGCVNAAHLVLAGVTARHQEFGLRCALGMSLKELMRQLLLEQLVIGLIGGILGLLLARSLTAYLTVLLPVAWPHTADVKLDGGVFLFTVGLSLIVGLLTAIQPCWQMRREANSLLSGLMAGRRVGESRTNQKSRRLLCVCQTAFVMMLLIGAGLFIRTLLNLQQVDWGYKPQKLLCLSVSRPEAAIDRGQEEARRYYSQAQQALADISGVESVSGVDYLPMRSQSVQIVGVNAVGGSAALDIGVDASPRVAMAGYFRTMGIPVLDGRDFERSDNPEGELVTILSKSLATKLWPSSRAVGQYVTMENSKPLRVLGVVADTRFFGPRSTPELELYQLYGQRVPRFFSFVVRTEDHPAYIHLKAQAALKKVSAVQPIDEISTMEEYVARSMQVPRSLAVLFNVLASLGLALALIGIYGIAWLFIRQSWRTLGIRLALGANPRVLIWRAVADCLGMIIPGMIVGAFLAVATGRLIESQLYEVRSADPLVFGVAASALLSMGAACSLLAARRILRIDPAAILREGEK